MRSEIVSVSILDALYTCRLPRLTSSYQKTYSEEFWPRVLTSYPYVLPYDIDIGLTLCK